MQIHRLLPAITTIAFRAEGLGKTRSLFLREEGTLTILKRIQKKKMMIIARIMIQRTVVYWMHFQPMTS